MYREIILVGSEINTVNINKLCEPKVEIFNVKTVGIYSYHYVSKRAPIYRYLLKRNWAHSVI